MPESHTCTFLPPGGNLKLECHDLSRVGLRWERRSGNWKNGGNGDREYREYSGTLTVLQVSEFPFYLHCNEIISSSMGSHFQNVGLNSEEECGGSSKIQRIIQQGVCLSFL